MTREELVESVVNATLGDFTKHAGIALTSPVAGKFTPTPEGVEAVCRFMRDCAKALAEAAGAMEFAASSLYPKGTPMDWDRDDRN